MTGVAYGPVSVTVELLTTAPGDPRAEVEWEVVEEATIKVSKPFRVNTLDGEVAQDFPVLSITKRTVSQILSPGHRTFEKPSD